MLKSIQSAALADWERRNLNAAGRYVGESLLAWGFGIPIGRYVPIYQRWSAFLEHRWATKARDLATRRNSHA